MFYVCFQGLSGSKPPPLNMVASLPRTTVTVPPLNPVSPGSSITSTASSLSAQGGRQNHSTAGGNSFAAALRKLAKQAEGPGVYNYLLIHLFKIVQQYLSLKLVCA